MIVSLVYICVASLLLWFIIYARGHVITKCVSAGLAVWFGVAIYYLAPNLAGWPVNGEIPDGSVVLSLRVVEPTPENSGWIYFWCNTQPDLKQDVANLLNPKTVFNYTGANEPRAYKRPYDRDLHKRILEAQKKQKKTRGGFMIIEKGMKKGKGNPGDGRKTPPEKMKFKIVNPIEILTKE